MWSLQPEAVLLAGPSLQSPVVNTASLYPVISGVLSSHAKQLSWTSILDILLQHSPLTCLLGQNSWDICPEADAPDTAPELFLLQHSFWDIPPATFLLPIPLTMLLQSSSCHIFPATFLAQHSSWDIPAETASSDIPPGAHLQGCRSVESVCSHHQQAERSHGQGGAHHL